jgi:integral membrane protein
MNDPQKNGVSRSKNRLLELVLIGLFAALSCVAVLTIRIPYPAPVGQPFLHFGNMVVILAALLIGGWQGGLSGSIGMGLSDILTGYGFATIKTVILKFGIGLFSGLAAQYGRRHPEKNPRPALFISGTVSLVLAAVILIGKLMAWPIFAKTSDMAYIFLFIIGALMTALAAVSCFLPKLTGEVLFIVLGAVAGIVWNVAGEFVGGTVTALLAGSALSAAMLASLMSLPATFINGAFSIVGAVLLYFPLRTALRSAHLDGALKR